MLCWTKVEQAPQADEAFARLGNEFAVLAEALEALAEVREGAAFLRDALNTSAEHPSRSVATRSMTSATRLMTGLDEAREHRGRGVAGIRMALRVGDEAAERQRVHVSIRDRAWRPTG